MKIEVLEEPLYQGAIACETGTFKKWLKIKHPDVEVITPKREKQGRSTRFYVGYAIGSVNC